MRSRLSCSVGPNWLIILCWVFILASGFNIPYQNIILLRWAIEQYRKYFLPFPVGTFCLLWIVFWITLLCVIPWLCQNTWWLICNYTKLTVVIVMSCVSHCIVCHVVFYVLLCFVLCVILWCVVYCVVSHIVMCFILWCLAYCLVCHIVLCVILYRV